MMTSKSDRSRIVIIIFLGSYICKTYESQSCQGTIVDTKNGEVSVVGPTAHKNIPQPDGGDRIDWRT